MRRKQESQTAKSKYPEMQCDEKPERGQGRGRRRRDAKKINKGPRSSIAKQCSTYTDHLNVDGSVIVGGGRDAKGVDGKRDYNV